MLKRDKIRRLDDYFLSLDQRPGRCVYFYRITGYSREIDGFIRKYYQTARTSGVVIEGRIPNPDEKNLAYYNEIMGMAFQMNVGFIGDSLKKWLPRMTPAQRETVAQAIFSTLNDLQSAGKNDNMLKNAYIKMMCWLYYKFERVVSKLGENQVPKILYEGDVSKYELLLLSVLCGAGCDIVLLEYKGDAGYLATDPGSAHSDLLTLQGTGTFPEHYSLKQVRTAIQEQANRQRLYGEAPTITNCTNAWLSGRVLDQILTVPSDRGTDPELFYNCFSRITGVEDKITYQNDLIHLHNELKKSGRGLIVTDKGIEPPKPDEISAIQRANYQNRDALLMDLSQKTGYSGNPVLKPVIRRAFIDVLLEAADAEQLPLLKLTNKAVTLLSWFRRYQAILFKNWQPPQIACFLYFGTCKNSTEALFLKFLARLPVDVIVLNPDLSAQCPLSDPLLYDVRHNDSLNLTDFPDSNTTVRVGTAAYHAERELDSLMYQDSGLYRSMQHGQAAPVILSTMYEEIAILWDQELKYRPNFSAEDNTVRMPVIFAKVSGVKDGQLAQYWSQIKSMVTPETLLIKSPPFVNTPDNPIRSCPADFLKNGKIQRNQIRSHPNYPYGFLRENMQEHILDKLQLLIDNKLIRGTFENGTEYRIVAVAMSMPKGIVRMLQNFDFTRKNPKVIYINTREQMISLEDSILMAFLNLLGFDVVFFVPTGYRTVENCYNRDILEEHQAGTYVYDLQVPDFRYISANTRQSWRDKIFKRGT